MPSLQIAIVGLPNVGKSTLFNALLKEQQALAANYPFATIEPNIGVVPVPDERLAILADVAKTKVIKPATVEFVDIAGLVKGASEGEGLGNQFLSHIRECAVVCHVVRAFQDDEIIREGSTDPVNDLEVIRMELMLADLATINKQVEPKGVKEREALDRWQMVRAFGKALENSTPIVRLIEDEGMRDGFGLSSFGREKVALLAKELGLLSAKTELFVLNVSEEQLMETGVEALNKQYCMQLHLQPSHLIVMSNKIESELATLADEDRMAYLKELGLEQSGLDRLIAAAYSSLQLQSFLTAGEKEVRAWTIRKGMTAREAAGVIHTDFERLMISAKVANYADFVQFHGWKGVKEAGKMRIEGRDYIMQDGDVVEYLIGK
jgi:hypothetical protein